MDTFLNSDSEEFRKLIGQMKQALGEVKEIQGKHQPTIADKYYLSSEEIMGYLHISPRTLQNLRDKQMICYTTIGGKILYPEDELLKLLYENYCS